MSQQRSSDQPSSSPFIFCKQCSKPLFPLSSVITEKANVWSDTVYTYELEDVLGETPCSVYSATNPGQHRFDVFRVRTQIPNRDDEAVSQGAQWAQPNITINFSAKKKAYSGDHSWFPPARWNFLECGNCSGHLGWGFHYFDEEKEKRLKEEKDERKRKAQEENEEKSKKENEDAKKEGDKEQNERKDEDEEEAEEAEEAEEQEEKHHEEDFFPEFLGIIFSRILVKDFPNTEWTDYLKQRSSITAKLLRLHLLREAWPALHAQERQQMLIALELMLHRYDEATKIAEEDSSSSSDDDDDENKNDDDDRQQQTEEKAKKKSHHLVQGKLAKSIVRDFDTLIIRGYERVIHAATSFISRLRARRDENPEDPALRRPHRIPFLRPTIDLRGYGVTPDEDEDVLFAEKNQNDDDDQYATDRKAVELIRAFYNRWHEQTEREYNRYERDLALGRLPTNLPAVRFGDDDDDDQDDERPGEDSEASASARDDEEVNNNENRFRDAMSSILMRFFGGGGAAVRREREDHIEEDDDDEEQEDDEEVDDDDDDEALLARLEARAAALDAAMNDEDYSDDDHEDYGGGSTTESEDGEDDTGNDNMEDVD